VKLFNLFHIFKLKDFWLLNSQVITSLDEAQAMAVDGEGLARALYNFAAQTTLELSLRKVQETLIIINISAKYVTKWLCYS